MMNETKRAALKDLRRVVVQEKGAIMNPNTPSLLDAAKAALAELDRLPEGRVLRRCCYVIASAHHLDECPASVLRAAIAREEERERVKRESRCSECGVPLDEPGLFCGRYGCDHGEQDVNF